MPLLANHIAVITGAASGIGRAIAKGFAREGARAVLLDINEQAAREAAKEIRDAHPGDNVAIVIGSSSQAMHRLVGSVAVSLARHSPVPLVIVP